MYGRLCRAARNESGYTLTELITVATIVGIIASIAVPFFLSQRQSGWRSTAASDVRNTAIVVEGLTAEGNPPDGLAVSAGSALLLLDGQPLASTSRSGGIELGYVRDDTRFCVCAGHDRLPNEGALAVYDSGGGGLVDSCGIPDTVCVTEPVATQFFEAAASSIGFHPTPIDPSPVLATDASARLEFTSVAGITSSTGGWAISFGSYQDGFHGYTLQLDRGYAGGAFTVEQWGTGSTTRPQIERVPDFDWTSATQVAAELQDGELRLFVNGALVVSHAIDPEHLTEGSFGVRQWGGVQPLGGDDVRTTLTVN